MGEVPGKSPVLQVQLVVYHSSPFGGAWRRNASNKESQTGQVGWDESGSG